MRTRSALVAMGLVFGLGWSANIVFSQEGGMEGKKEEKPAGEKAPPAGPSPEEMAAWQKAMTPGEPHKKMASHEGTWDTAGKFWMAPDQPPTESKGVAKFKMVLGGRFEQQDFAGDMMGMPFVGIGFYGYDNVSQKYVSTWMDTMSTSQMRLEGTADEKGVITLSGTMPDPMSGKDCKVRMVATDKDKDTMLLEMFVDDGKGKGEMKCMELVYTRRK